ncbi:putative reverse transcriptase domain-containing protein [Tanacetum coccineum]
MLKVLPWKGVVHFGKRGKLNPRYVGPFKLLGKVGEVAYKLELPEELSRVHNTFHVSNLKKCYADEPLAVPLDGLHLDARLNLLRKTVYIPEPEYPEDLVPAEDEAPTPLLPPFFLSPRIRPLSPRALEVEMRDVASAYYHSLHPSGTPPLLPIPLPAPSTSRRADIPKADTPPRKRLLLTTPRPGCEIGESSAACCLLRQPDPYKRPDSRYERRIMTALESLLGLKLLQALEHRVTVLETEARHHEWQRQAADDLVVQHIMRTQSLEAGAHVDTWRRSGSIPRLYVAAMAEAEASMDTEWLPYIGMFPEEIDKIEKYIGGLPDMILGSVKASKSKTMQEVIEFTTELMEDKTHAYAERQAERKRKYDDLSKNNQNQQSKRQNTGQAYTAGNSDRKSYAGSKPLCSKCNCHHEAGPCPPRCSNCNRVGHLARDCRIRPANNNNNNNRNNNSNNNNRNNNNNNNRNNNNNQQGNGCFECGAQGHFKRNCPRLRNNDRGNQAGNDRAPAKVYVVGNAGANPDNVVAELGSFDAIIGMDWLAKYQAVIVCAEKIVRIPWRNKTLIIHGDGSTQEKQKVEDKSENKRLEGVPIVQDFSETTGTLSIGGLPRMKELSEATERAIIRQRLLKTQFSHWVTPNRYPLPKIDDLIDQLQASSVYSKIERKNKQEHEEHLKIILELLKKEELYAKFSKCEFWIPKVQFLGHVIDSEGIHVDPVKIESIKDWTSPKSPTEIRQFLGLAGYYQRFIEGFSKIAKPMTKLTQKKFKFEWGDKQEAAFQQLKQKLCSAPILALPERSEDFIAYCDASKKGLGAVLMQREKWIIRYHTGKANVVADALSRKEREPPLRVRA